MAWWKQYGDGNSNQSISDNELRIYGRVYVVAIDLYCDRGRSWILLWFCGLQVCGLRFHHMSFSLRELKLCAFQSKGDDHHWYCQCDQLGRIHCCHCHCHHCNACIESSVQFSNNNCTTIIIISSSSSGLWQWHRNNDITRGANELSSVKSIIIIEHYFEHVVTEQCVCVHSDCFIIITVIIFVIIIFEQCTVAVTESITLCSVSIIWVWSFTSNTIITTCVCYSCGLSLKCDDHNIFHQRNDTSVNKY